MGNEKSVVPTNQQIQTTQPDSMLGDESLIQIAAESEKRVAAVIKIKTMALAVTNPRDWTIQGDNPDMQTSGLEKVARVFGISWKELGEPVRENEESGHFMYTYRGEFSLHGKSITVIGTRSSKDGFFTKYEYPKGEDRKKLPPTEIDAGDVKKSAFTNMIRNGVGRILGIRNMTWADLALVGITKEMVEKGGGKITYKSTAKSGDATITSDDATQVDIFVSAVTFKEGEKNGKKWKLYKIQNGEKTYTTFDEDIAVIAKQAMTHKQKVTVVFEAKGDNLNIKNIFACKEEPKPTETKTAGKVDPNNPLGIEWQTKNGMKKL
jgi:hypothetical protein